MLRCAPPVLAISWSVYPPMLAHATTLFYSGNYDLNDATTNETNVPVNIAGTNTTQKSLVYDNFTVPAGQNWTLTNVYSNNQVAYYTAPTKATWEIRKGMSAGNGGTVVSSGDTTATLTLKTAADFNNYIDTEYTVSATVPSVALTAGSYWVAVAPDGVSTDNGDQSYIETTSGAGSIGVVGGVSSNQYVFTGFANSATPGAQNFVATNLDFSAGIVGTAVSTPEPAIGLAAVLAGGLFLTRRSWRSRQGLRQPG
jgi:hypothetical protein